jgi:hypothetical protein
MVVLPIVVLPTFIGIANAIGPALVWPRASPRRSSR